MRLRIVIDCYATSPTIFRFLFLSRLILELLASMTIIVIGHVDIGIIFYCIGNSQ